MGKYVDLTGQRFGRLTVIEYAGKDKHRNILWLCKCDCGTETIVFSGNLKRGNTFSCGCYQRERTKDAHTTHNLTHTNPRLYEIWSDMKKRCFKPNTTGYIHWGGRGISVCHEWLEYKSFYDWAISNGYKDFLTIERVDNDGNYEPDNCKWITKGEQSRNTTRNHKVTFNKETMTLSEWSRKMGMSASTLRFRLIHGWSVEKALTTPVRKGKYNCG
jgi:hypothetical protein